MSTVLTVLPSKCISSRFRHTHQIDPNSYADKRRFLQRLSGAEKLTLVEEPEEGAWGEVVRRTKRFDPE